jgi:hypothetical protein
MTGEPAEKETPPYPQQTGEAFAAEVVEPPRRSGWTACLIGCLVIAVIGVCVCGGVVWYFYANVGHFKSLMADAARQAIVSGIRESELEESEKQAIIAQVDRVIDQYKAGDISLQQLQQVMEQLAESPLMGAIVVFSVEANYVEPSGLDEEEKQQARRTLQRVLRGVTEEKIRMEELEPAMEHVTVQRAGGSRELKQSISDEDLRAFLSDLKEKADQAEIPDEPFEIRISDEFRKAVDRALGEN